MTDAISAHPPRLQVPRGACDTHMHFYDPKYPLAPTALGPPPAGEVATYRALQRRLGTERTVVVQPTAYGIDNRCTLAGMAALGLEGTRGIAVVDDQASDDHLEALTKGGMRGARFQMLPGGAIPWEMLDRIAERVQDFGWHVQLQTDGRNFPDREAQIMSWPGRIVIDHVGKFLEPVLPEHPAFRCLMRFIDTGRVWVKLSAPYEVSKTGAPLYQDVSRLAKALVKAAPERMLWASNWPHPSVKSPPDDAMLLDLLLDWVADENVRKRILVDNPAEVYGF
ncbi:D-galactarolactone isomerase [Rhizobiales bacterium GAS113]|jgi:D-galactarolactone isomerase|nr:D-galactarolactone isomerase [Rhizobiales bacterium GAS113]SED22094.1 D-galactarolactone isomerase [Rhizobiales bacterium GAS188]